MFRAPRSLKLRPRAPRHSHARHPVPRACLPVGIMSSAFIVSRLQPVVAASFALCQNGVTGTPERMRKRAVDTSSNRHANVSSDGDAPAPGATLAGIASVARARVRARIAPPARRPNDEAQPRVPDMPTARDEQNKTFFFRKKWSEVCVSVLGACCAVVTRVNQLGCVRV